MSKDLKRHLAKKIYQQPISTFLNALNFSNLRSINLNTTWENSLKFSCEVKSKTKKAPQHPDIILLDIYSKEM